MTTASHSPTAWRQPLLALGALLLGVLWLYRQTALGMEAIWASSDTYAHGYVVPAISLWLIWRIRHTLAPMQPSPSLLATGLLAGVALFWLLGDLVAVNVTTQLALVAMLVLCVPAVLGWKLARAMAFPLGFLFFAVPMGEFLLPVLMERTADFTILALRWSGVPVYREGLHFIIPSGSWSVVEACSGIRYLIASITVGCIFAYLSYRSLHKRLLFVLVSIAVPLVANWLRAYMIVMLGHLSGNELATGVDHLIYGWVFFGVVIMVMLLIGARWADPEMASVPAAEAAPGHVAASNPTRRKAAFWLAALVALGVLLSPHVGKRVLQWSVSSVPVSMVPPVPQTPWALMPGPEIAWRPAFQNPSAESHTAFREPAGTTVGVHVTYYRQQDYQRKLVTSSNVLVTSNDKNWAKVTEGHQDTQLAGQSLRVDTTEIREQSGAMASTAQRLWIWRFYWVPDRFTASDVQAKLQGAWRLLTGQGDDAAIVVIYTPLNPQVPEPEARQAANSVLQSFLQSQGGALQASLQQTREAR